MNRVHRTPMKAGCRFALYYIQRSGAVTDISLVLHACGLDWSGRPLYRTLLPLPVGSMHEHQSNLTGRPGRDA